MDQTLEALALFCDNYWDLIDEKRNASDILLFKSINMYLSKHVRGILGLYLGLSDDAKWYGIEMKQFFSLVCNICGVAWTVKHAMEHHLLGEKKTALD